MSARLVCNWENYNRIFQVGHTLVKQEFVRRNLQSHDVAEQALCDEHRLNRFLVEKHPLPGREWSNLVNVLKIDIDDWLEIADVTPVASIQPKQLAGCGDTVGEQADVRIKNTLGIMTDFFRQATLEYRSSPGQTPATAQ